MAFIFGDPEEFQAAVRAQHDRQQMSAEATYLETERFFDEMSLDGLRILHRLLMEDNPYLAGYISAVAKYKHGACARCMVVHAHGAPDAIPAEWVQPPPEGFVLEDTPPGWFPSLRDYPGVTNSDGTPYCHTCRGDRAFEVCNHPSGSHGQTQSPCPEPILAPCPECSHPEWYEYYTHVTMPCTGCEKETDHLPMGERNCFVCTMCGSRDDYGTSWKPPT